MDSGEPKGPPSGFCYLDPQICNAGTWSTSKTPSFILAKPLTLKKAAPNNVRQKLSTLHGQGQNLILSLDTLSQGPS